MQFQHPFCNLFPGLGGACERGVGVLSFSGILEGEGLGVRACFRGRRRRVHGGRRLAG